MGTPVPPTAVPSELATAIVGSPVSASSWGGVTISQLAFLLGRAVEHVASIRLHGLASRTATATDAYIQYRPSPGCRLVYIRVDVGPAETHNLTGGAVVPQGNRCTIGLTLPSGAVLVDADTLDGATILAMGSPRQAGRTSYETWVSLGAAGSVSDAIGDWKVTITGSGGDTHSGLQHITLTEVPVPFLLPESSEPGSILSYAHPRNDLHDGDAGGGTGIPKLVSAEQDARTKVRFHWQIGTYENDNDSWSTASAVYAGLNWGDAIGTTYNPVHTLRARNIYGTSTGNTCTLRVRYKSSDAGSFRVTRTPAGGAGGTVTLALPSGGGAWTTASGTFVVPASGTSQEVELYFEALIDSGTLRISSIAIIEAETP